MKKFLIPFVILFFVVLVSELSWGQANCSQTSVGLVPINDLGSGTYNGWTGGLYPNGSNYMPTMHHDAGMNFSFQVQPLNLNGQSDPVNGKIVFLSIGFSNATQEFSTFIPLVNALSDKNPKLQLIDGAQGGQTATILSTPTNAGYDAYWTTVSNRLTNSGASANQVQVVWFKDDNQAGSTPLQDHYDTLVVQTKRIMNELKSRFPNIRQCFIASRIYAGYASTTLNPEPYAYRNGWAMKKVIEDQINGDPLLQYALPNANAPWLSWGVYQWADGTNPRSDGLTWICPDDFQNDGTHPSATGQLKVANLLLDFFSTDSTTCPWFLDNCAVASGLHHEVSFNNLHIYPNPSNSGITVEFISQRSFPVTFQVEDLTGRCIFKSQLQVSAGINKLPVHDTEHLAGGSYTIRLVSEHDIVLRKFTMVR